MTASIATTCSRLLSVCAALVVCGLAAAEEPLLPLSADRMAVWEPPADFDPFAEFALTAWLDEQWYMPQTTHAALRHVALAHSQAASEAVPDPCDPLNERPLGALGIAIGTPDGELPEDHAAACFDSLPGLGYPPPRTRGWGLFAYNWQASALVHRPLYFEEINVERYGYRCGCCLQPAASAAHFFGTVAALPYCMTVQCPHECVYTLGHYRPGSCPPRQRHWPQCRP